MSGISVIVLGAVLFARREQSPQPVPVAAVGDLAPMASAPVDPPVEPGKPGFRIEVTGDVSTSIDSAALAARPAVLVATDRRAWRLSELLDGVYARPGTTIDAVTSEGARLSLRGDGQRGEDVLLVRRQNGELYIGWLIEGASVDSRSLADIERPAERIEQVVRLEAAAPVAKAPLPAANLIILVDGKPLRTITAKDFPASAKLQMQSERGSVAAIDVHGLFRAQLESLEAGGEHVVAAPPSRDARPVVYLNRRERFKFAWVDPSGQPIAGTKQREVSQLALRTGARVAAP